jgi:hypothetical protein
MNMMNITSIARPRHRPADLHYEADCKAALDPVLRGLLDMAEAAGWDRRKAAYTLMFLAARHVTGDEADSPPRYQEAAPAALDWRAGQLKTQTGAVPGSE